MASQYWALWASAKSWAFGHAFCLAAGILNGWQCALECGCVGAVGPPLASPGLYSPALQVPLAVPKTLFPGFKNPLVGGDVSEVWASV